MYTKHIHTFLFVACSLLISSCGEKNEENTTPETSTEAGVTSDFVLPNEIDELMASIDAEQDKMPQAKSLNYAKEDQSLAYVTAYLDKNNVIRKMIFFKQVGASEKIARSVFYFNGGTQFASKLIEEKKNDKKKPYYSETITFYDKKGKASASKVRTADFEELLENESYVKTKPVALNAKEAYEVFNQKGEYAVTYQGFIESGDYLFLIVGENSPNGYTSSLSVQSLSPVVQHLRKSGSKELGRPLMVNYEHILDQNGYEIQILHDVQFASQKK